MTDTYLERINSPADLKTLSVAEMEGLAEEIRQFILNSVSRTGGHLASNLGAVELTLALHHVFDFQRDKLLWDVGHQCYTHKIITGRKAGFERLRHAGGISGFPNPSESDYDQFTVGHAGTSIATFAATLLGDPEALAPAIVFAVILAVEKLITIHHSNSFLAEFIPRDLKSLLDGQHATVEPTASVSPLRQKPQGPEEILSVR